MKKHPNYPTIPGLCLAAKLFFLSIPRFLIFLSSSLQSSLLQSSIWLSSFCDDRNTHNIRNQSCLGRFDINCTEHCYSEHRVAWLTTIWAIFLLQWWLWHGTLCSSFRKLIYRKFLLLFRADFRSYRRKNSTHFFISIRLGSVNSPLFSS